MQTITVEGKIYTPTDFIDVQGEAPAAVTTLPPPLLLFLQEWFSPSPSLRLHTSGSTGTPKEIVVLKSKMMQSARITCDYLGLKQGDKALLCLPLDFIAGKMMVVRALFAGLNLFPEEPDGHPLANTDTHFDFAAMVPLQAYNSLRDESQKQKLSHIKHLIIGGGAIDPALEKELLTLPNAVYSTYGMTETLSHIALRRLNGRNPGRFYTPLPSVELSLTPDNRLIVDAPLVADERCITNDIAELLPDGRFRIIGRSDNTINSGGIKIQIEEVEQLLSAHIEANFAITSIPHPKFGESVVLLVDDSVNPQAIATIVTTILPRHQQPAIIHLTQSIPLTGNGKIDRAATKDLAKKMNLSSPTTIHIH